MTHWVALDKRTTEYADHISAFQEREIESNFRDFAGRKTDHQKPPAPRDRAQRCFRVRSADRIVDYVDALAAGDAAQAFLHIFVGVVDDLVGAALAAERELAIGRCAGD